MSDHRSDISQRILHTVCQASKRVPLEKYAAAASKEPAALYADQQHQQYPIDTPEHTVLSAAYAAYAGDIPALINIKTAGVFWGIEDTVNAVIDDVAQCVRPVKYAVDATIDGVQHRYFPYDDRDTCVQAAKDFYAQRHKFPLSVRLKTASQLYHDLVDYAALHAIPNEAALYIKQAAGLLEPCIECAQAMVLQRMNRKHAKHAAFTKIAHIIQEIQNAPGWDKIALEAFDALDHELKLKNHYGYSLRLPEEDLYVQPSETSQLTLGFNDIA